MSNKKSEKLKNIYNKYINIFNSLRRKQDIIINKCIENKENEKIEEIRKKLNNI